MWFDVKEGILWSDEKVKGTELGHQTCMTVSSPFYFATRTEASRFIFDVLNCDNEAVL